MRPSRFNFRRSPRRGSVLIVALLICALIAIALGSYLNLNLTSTRLAQRTFYGYAALNLAEAGTEEGVWSFNRAGVGDATGWDAWTKNGGAAWQSFSGFDLYANHPGTVKVYVDHFNPPSNVQPKIIAQATVGAAGDQPQTKMIEVTLRRRSYFANGLVAKDRVVFNGANASVDSWNSDPDNDPATLPVPYSAAVRTDHGSVASTAVLNTSVAVNQANVWGYVATGGAQPQVGSQGTIRGVGTPANVAVDSSRVSTDFNADFDVLAAPVEGTPLFTLGATLGTKGTVTRWRCIGVSLSGDQTLTILGDVILVITAGSGTPAINVTGNASIVIPADSSLKVYAEGDVKIAGRGLGNSNAQPVTCQIWGTNKGTLGQSIEIAGLGSLSAVVYAPNGDVKINGNGAVMGSIIARNITLVGNAAFHYDEALANYGNGAPYGVAKWRELTTEADRARYSAVFEGW